MITGKASDEYPVKLATNSCTITDVPDDAHPDLFAVAAWTVVAPWTTLGQRGMRSASAAAGPAGMFAAVSEPSPAGALARE